MLLDELALDDEDCEEDWFKLLGMSESELVPSLAPRTHRVPFVLGKEEYKRLS